jgi:hypothetical protein
LLLHVLRVLRFRQLIAVLNDLEFFYLNDNSTEMIQAKAFRLFLLLMGSHGDVLGRSVEADGKIKASAVQHDQAAPFTNEELPWPDFDGPSAVYSGREPVNLLSEDKEVRTN